MNHEEIVKSVIFDIQRTHMEGWGERLRQAREAAEMTQQGLAELLRVGLSTLQRYENEKTAPDLRVLLKVSELTGWSVERLATGQGAETRPPASSIEKKRAARIEGATEREEAGRRVPLLDRNAGLEPSVELGEQPAPQATGDYVIEAFLRGLQLNLMGGEASIRLDVRVTGPEAHVVRTFLDVVAPGATPEPKPEGEGDVRPASR
jgi:transcriptional regulator with XRE-family HTH domain